MATVKFEGWATAHRHPSGVYGGLACSPKEATGFSCDRSQNRCSNPQAVLRVTEIFFSIQGESSYAGLPCAFVRLTGCNLRCVWCDTAYAFEGGDEMSIDDVARRVATFGVKLVEVTGGEPLLQDDCVPLMERLLRDGYRVLLETSGSRSLARVPTDVVKIVDVKCPGSGMLEQNRADVLSQLAPHDEVKFVIADERDYRFAVERARTIAPRNAVLFSPVHGGLNPAMLAEWMLRDQAPARLQVQLHKYLWGADARGV